jgi:hypothetical protein
MSSGIFEAYHVIFGLCVFILIISKSHSICNFLSVVFSLLSGNAGLEAAVNWVVEHENDPDIDEMPMVCYMFFFSLWHMCILLFFFFSLLI